LEAGNTEFTDGMKSTNLN